MSDRISQWTREYVTEEQIASIFELTVEELRKYKPTASWYAQKLSIVLHELASEGLDPDDFDLKSIKRLGVLTYRDSELLHRAQELFGSTIYHYHVPLTDRDKIRSRIKYRQGQAIMVPAKSEKESVEVGKPRTVKMMEVFTQIELSGARLATVKDIEYAFYARPRNKATQVWLLGID